MGDKNIILKKLYEDKAGFGSIKTTLDDARKVDKTITLQDVQNFFNANVENKKQLRGTNAFVAPHPKYQYQMDLFFIPDDEFLENQNFKVGMLMIDVFTRYMVVVPIKSKSEKTGDIAAGLIECLHKMNGKPKILYTDDEASLSSDDIQKYLKEQNIQHVITRSKAWFAERSIRTFKDMLYKRIEHSKNQNIQWNDLVYEILLTYNNKMKNSTTKYTPVEATKPENELNVRLNLLLQKRHTRIYPLLEVGSKVKILRKKKINEKERTSTWLSDVHEVEIITNSLGITYFKLKGLDRLYLRNELLKL